MKAPKICCIFKNLAVDYFTLTAVHSADKFSFFKWAANLWHCCNAGKERNWWWFPLGLLDFFVFWKLRREWKDLSSKSSKPVLIIEWITKWMNESFIFKTVKVDQFNFSNCKGLEIIYFFNFSRALGQGAFGEVYQGYFKVNFVGAFN